MFARLSSVFLCALLALTAFTAEIKADVLHARSIIQTHHTSFTLPNNPSGIIDSTASITQQVGRVRLASHQIHCIGLTIMYAGRAPDGIVLS
ncbi:hypothetical protein DFH29DRAFT_447900 [Suillus ampliporus]|nr:hypothetical protein DFH29DRAFT_447900 [Suillus ampliporus]